jgi:hypothetical protein
MVFEALIDRVGENGTLAIVTVVDRGGWRVA